MTIETTRKPGLDYRQPKAAQLNAWAFNDYYARLRLLALSMFEWKGLPESVSARYLEQTLFDMGRAVFINDPNLGFLGLRVTAAGKLNVYNEPVRYTAYATTYTKQFDADECVLIRNNWDQNPTEPTIRLFAMRLADVERSADVNVKAQKTPVMIVCDDKQRLTLKNLYQQYDGNEPVIYGDRSLNLEGIKAIKTDAPFVADKLQAYKKEIWNECLSFLGLNNVSIEKKERLITDEAEANNQQIEMSAQIMLLARQEAAAAINKLFGLSVSVGLRTTPETAPGSDEEDEEADPEEGKEEGENG